MASLSSPIMDRGNQSPHRASPTPMVSASPVPPSPTRDSSSRGSQLVAGPGDSTSLNVQIETLKSKLKVMEKKRLNDREKLAQMQEDNKRTLKLENIVKRLQLKLTPMHEEIQSLREKVKTLEADNIKLSEDYHKNDDAIEIATLDREMAEERSETLALELESLKKKFEDLELEAEILREENSLFSSEDKDNGKKNDATESHSNESGTILRLEKRNEQLEAALVKLREVYNSQESSFKETSNSLEKEKSNNQTLSSSYEQTAQKLVEAESVISDLRVQLDNALGAEDMIESLTEKNLELSERCEQLQRTIDELETLKELNDELEANTSYREHQLTQEIDKLESKNSDISTKIREYEDRNAYLESAILKFRDLVRTLNDEITSLKHTENQSDNETENAKMVYDQTKAIDDLNLDTRSTSIVKTMDLELRRFESQQAVNHLSIVKNYLPDEYSSDEQSIETLLRLEKISFQCDLMVSYFKERLPIENATLNAKICIALFEMKNSALILVNLIQESTAEIFQTFSSIFEQIDGITNQLKQHIDDLQQENIRENDLLQKLNSTLLSLQNASSAYSGQSLVKSTNVIVGNIQLYSDLSVLLIQNVIPVSKDAASLLNEINKETSTSISRGKVSVTKIYNQLLELNNNDSQKTIELSQNDFSKLIKAENKCISLANFYVSISTKVDDQDESNMLSCLTHLDNTNNNFSDSVRRNTKELEEAVSQISLSEVKKSNPKDAPWKVRASKISDLKRLEKEQGKEITELKEQEKKFAKSMRSKDKTIEELRVKVELLDSRLSKTKENDKTVSELKKSLEAATNEEKSLQDTVGALKHKLTEQSNQLEKYKKEIKEPPKAPEGKIMIAADASVISLQQEVSSLRQAVNYLSTQTPVSTTETDILSLKPIHSSSGNPQSLVQRYCRTIFKDIRRSIAVFDLIKVQQMENTKWRPLKLTNRARVTRQVEAMEHIQDKINNLLRSCAIGAK